MRHGSWLVAVAIGASTILSPTAWSADDFDWEAAIRGVDLVIPDSRTAFFDIVLEDETGAVIGGVEAMADHRFKQFRYDTPLRYRDDILMIDGHLLILDEAHGAERPSAVSFRDIQDKPLFYLLAGTFRDLLETHEIASVDDVGGGQKQLTLGEAGGYVVFEHVTVLADGTTHRPSQANLHDREDDILWKITYGYSEPPLGAGLDLVIPSTIDVVLAEGEDTTAYRLRIENFRIGPSGQISHGALHGLE